MASGPKARLKTRVISPTRVSSRTLNSSCRRFSSSSEYSHQLLSMLPVKAAKVSSRVRSSSESRSLTSWA